MRWRIWLGARNSVHIRTSFTRRIVYVRSGAGLKEKKQQKMAQDLYLYRSLSTWTKGEEEHLLNKLSNNPKYNVIFEGGACGTTCGHKIWALCPCFWGETDMQRPRNKTRAMEFETSRRGLPSSSFPKLIYWRGSFKSSNSCIFVAKSSFFLSCQCKVVVVKTGGKYSLPPQSDLPD